MAAKIYNINAGASFVDVLAEHFLKYYKNQPEELANVLFLLPNRRACQSLSEAFVRLKGLEPTILPQIVPIADIEEDEVFLTGQSNILQDLSPEITKNRASVYFQQAYIAETGVRFWTSFFSSSLCLGRKFSGAD